MNDKRRALLARLRAMFRVEAAEHLTSLGNELVSYEQAASEERAAILERAFRHAHSLKGAARTVGLQSAESLCVALENVFAILKERPVAVSTEAFDTLHRARETLASLCADPDAEVPTELADRRKRSVAALQVVARSLAADATEAAPATPSPRPASGRRPREESTTGTARGGATHRLAIAVAADTVRVASVRLQEVLTAAEELIGPKLAARSHADQLRALARELAAWNRERERELLAEQRRTREAALRGSRVPVLVASRRLESALIGLAAATRQHAVALASIADELLAQGRQLLLLPCSALVGTIPSLARDLARAQGKQVELRVSGEDVEIDRRIIDELKDPLVHLLNNCIDHGVEPPALRAKAGKPATALLQLDIDTVEGNRVELTLRDDGPGVDTEKVRAAAVRHGLLTEAEADEAEPAVIDALVFHSGLTTTADVTRLSGRGLGLAIVEERVQRLGGSVELASTRGEGTTFRLRVPSTLSTFRGVIVETAGSRFVLPTTKIQRVLQIGRDTIKSVGNRATVSIGGQALAVVALRDVLELTRPGRPGTEKVTLVVIRSGSGKPAIGLVVDAVEDERELVARSLGPQLLRVENIAGAAIVDSQDVLLPILRAEDLVRGAARAGYALPGDAAEGLGERAPHLLIAEDSITSRTLLQTILERAGYEVTTAVDGVDALTKLHGAAFDALVTDVDMPRMNGFELTRRVRLDEALRTLPVVLVTALESRKDRAYGLEVGASAYVVKSSFDQDDLLDTLRSLV